MAGARVCSDLREEEKDCGKKEKIELIHCGGVLILRGRRWRLSWASRSGGGSSDPLAATQLLEEDDDHLPRFVKTKRYLVSGRLSGLKAGLDAAR
jgi:hypothetical protein